MGTGILFLTIFNQPSKYLCQMQLSDSPYTLHADSRDPSRFFYSYVMFCLYSGPLISLIDILNQLTCIYDLCIFERSNIHRQRERIRHRLGLL